MFQLRAYQPNQDESALLELWALAFGPTWPLARASLRRETRESLPADTLLAEVEGQLAGFAITQQAGERGSLLALAVHPQHRRRGLGRLLCQAAASRLVECGARRMQLGAGALGYFWPGVPANLPGAWAFFQAQGWAEQERSYDLVRQLDGRATPGWVWQRVPGFVIDPATATDRAVTLAFVAREAPEWLPYFALAFEEDRPGDVILARQPSGAIRGACLAECQGARWPARFEGRVGAPGCMLVAEAARGRGIGMALTARAGEVLYTKGCQTSFIGWTWLVDWYGKLGYSVWQEYIMSSRPLIHDSTAL